MTGALRNIFRKRPRGEQEALVMMFELFFM